MSRKKQKSATVDATAELTVSSAAAASLFDVKPGTLRMWKTRGAAGSVGHNRWFLPDLMEWFQNNILESRLDTSDPELATSKRLYWASKARREQLRADEEGEVLINRSSISPGLIRLISTFKNGLLQLKQRLPPRLVGKELAAMLPIVHEEACTILAGMTRTKWRVDFHLLPAEIQDLADQCDAAFEELEK
jgi:hypothetical protein